MKGTKREKSSSQSDSSQSYFFLSIANLPEPKGANNEELNLPIFGTIKSSKAGVQLVSMLVLLDYSANDFCKKKKKSYLFVFFFFNITFLNHVYHIFLESFFFLSHLLAIVKGKKKKKLSVISNSGL